VKEQIETIAIAASELSPQSRTAFMLAVAERTALVFHQFAIPASVIVFDRALNAGWSYLQGSGGIEGVLWTLEELGQLPEAESDDSHLPSFYAMIALHILRQALGDIGAGGGAFDVVRSVCFGAADLYA
jgi:hypothetical protein